MRDILPRISPLGDSALLVELADAVSLDVNDRVRALDARLQESPLAGIQACVPGYTSLLVFYDPLVVGVTAVTDWVMDHLKGADSVSAAQPKCIEVSVHYGGQDGPDLVDLAKQCGMTPSRVVALHTAPTYRVGMMGFTPGFVYLIGLNPALAAARLATPRTHVPAGSVGIAGSQTGIYPLDSPGGWQLIGRTDQILFNPQREHPFLFSPGDEVRFIPIPGGVMP